MHLTLLPHLVPEQLLQYEHMSVHIVDEICAWAAPAVAFSHHV